MEKISSVLGEADVDQDHFLVRPNYFTQLWMTLGDLMPDKFKFQSKEELMTAIKDFVENIENEIPGSVSWTMNHGSLQYPLLWFISYESTNFKDENKIQIRELLHELEEMTCELEQIQMKDLVEILRSDMDSLVERISTSDGVLQTSIADQMRHRHNLSNMTYVS